METVKQVGMNKKYYNGLKQLAKVIAELNILYFEERKKKNILFKYFTFLPTAGRRVLLGSVR